jgi:hypothetical protein
MPIIEHVANAEERYVPVRPLRPRVEGNAGQTGSALLAIFLVSITTIVFALCSERLDHWFLLPTCLCGILMAMDALQWIRGRLDLYDPVGIIGLLGIHFFFLAPLLHVLWDFYIPDIAAPPDWRDWLGYMAMLNLFGLLAYRLARSCFSGEGGRFHSTWRINNRMLNFVFIGLVLISTTAQLWVYAHFGGVTGYIDSRMEDPRSMQGMGWILMISESAPILASFFVIVHMRKRKTSLLLIAAALVALFVVQLAFGGLRGSRSETVELFFWVVGCYHFLVRPVPRRFIFAGGVLLAVFLYLYAFYKNMGKDATQVFTASAEDRHYLELQTHRTPAFLLLVDLGRSDLQAYVLFRFLTDGKDLEYAKGRTYLGAICEWIPRWILPDRPDTKLREGTEVQTGSGYDENYPSSRVYGLGGEAMLNFGPVGVPFAYALLGLLTAWFRRAVNQLSTGDSRLLLVPFGVFMLVGIMMGDSDNVAFGLAKNGLLPFMLVFLSSDRVSATLSPRRILSGLELVKLSQHRTPF